MLKNTAASGAVVSGAAKKSIMKILDGQNEEIHKLFTIEG